MSEPASTLDNWLDRFQGELLRVPEYESPFDQRKNLVVDLADYIAFFVFADLPLKLRGVCKFIEQRYYRPGSQYYFAGRFKSPSAAIVKHAYTLFGVALPTIYRPTTVPYLSLAVAARRCLSANGVNARALTPVLAALRNALAFARKDQSSAPDFMNYLRHTGYWFDLWCAHDYQLVSWVLSRDNGAEFLHYMPVQRDFLSAIGLTKFVSLCFRSIQFTSDTALFSLARVLCSLAKNEGGIYRCPRLYSYMADAVLTLGEQQFISAARVEHFVVCCVKSAFSPDPHEFTFRTKFDKPTQPFCGLRDYCLRGCYSFDDYRTRYDPTLSLLRGCLRYMPPACWPLPTGFSWCEALSSHFRLSDGHTCVYQPFEVVRVVLSTPEMRQKVSDYWGMVCECIAGSRSLGDQLDAFLPTAADIGTQEIWLQSLLEADFFKPDLDTGLSVLRCWNLVYPHSLADEPTSPVLSDTAYMKWLTYAIDSDAALEEFRKWNVIVVRHGPSTKRVNFLPATRASTVRLLLMESLLRTLTYSSESTARFVSLVSSTPFLLAVVTQNTGVLSQWNTILGVVRLRTATTQVLDWSAIYAATQAAADQSKSSIRKRKRAEAEQSPAPVKQAKLGEFHTPSASESSQTTRSPS